MIVLGSFECFKSVLSHSSLVRVFKFSFCVFKSIYIRLAPLVKPRLEQSLLTSLLQLSQIGFNLCVTFVMHHIYRERKIKAISY